jgi:murein DD-endopeptidase MepM/ murein hydrolase activator NlpD
MIDFSRYPFHSVIDLPDNFEVFDFTQGYDAERVRKIPFGVGKFNEVRKNMYTTELFAGNRNIHMGIDIAAPVNHPVKSFYDGSVFMFAYNGAAGDYGHTLIIKYVFDGTALYALYGHLSETSTAGKRVGQTVRAGEVIGFIGDKHENGGWNPHLHLQLSLEEPAVCDMPGAVSKENLQEALKIYLDPQLVLGKLY